MKKINKKPVILTLLFSLTLIMFSCVDDEFDTPPPRTIPEGDPITIQEVKDLFDAEGDYVFTADKSIYAVVTMDDKSGNIYRTAYIQDETGAIALHMEASGGLYQGDSLRLQLNGLKVGQYNKLFQIDAPDGNGFTMDDYVTKLDTKVEVTPDSVSIIDISQGMDYYQGRLIKLYNVQFVASDTSKTYADGDNQITENRTLEDVNGDEIIVRTSGYASFANDSIPNGSGSIVAILGQYGNTPQLYIRSTEEVEMDNERLSGGVVEILGTSTTVSTLNESFNSATANENFAENGWLNANKEGERYWQGKEFESNKYAQSTAYNATSENIEMWLVSPGIELSTAKKLNFDTNTGYYKHEGLTIWVSTDFDGNNSNLFSSTWTEITDQATIAVGPDNAYGTWTNSGNIDLSSYSGTIYILFKYVGDNDINTTTFQLDNVQVTDL